MSDKPAVKPGDWITFGNGPLSKSAVVCAVYQDASLGDIEVVYLDDRDRAINEEMVWKNNKWEFKYSGPNGGYADKSDRLGGFVLQLRRGRY